MEKKNGLIVMGAIILVAVAVIIGFRDNIPGMSGTDENVQGLAGARPTPIQDVKETMTCVFSTKENHLCTGQSATNTYYCNGTTDCSIGISGPRGSWVMWGAQAFGPNGTIPCNGWYNQTLDGRGEKFQFSC